MPAASTEPVDLPVALERLKAALAQGQPADAETALQPLLGHPGLPAAALDPAVRQLAQYWLSQRDWGRAAEGFARLHQPEPTDRLQQRFATNLKALRSCRPALHDQLMGHRPAGDAPRYRVIQGSAGRTLMAERKTDGSPDGPTHQVVAPGEQWDDFRHEALRSIRAKPDQPIVLLGLGDGYAVNLLAEHPPELFMDMAMTVHLVEPDLDRLMLALHLHDWSADAGPVRDPRFRWHVGGDWQVRFRQAWKREPWTPQPALAVCPDPEAQSQLAVTIRDLNQAYQAEVAEHVVRAKRYYAQRSRPEILDVLGDNPPRRPRMLLMTSRFTTVLQYATADTARAFDDLGWETRTLLETHPHERFGVGVFAQTLVDFEPDVVLSIDATRHRLGGAVPDELPYVCWIQDALPQLMNAELGRAIGTRDYVLSFFNPRLVGDHDYPARQCIDMPMMVTADRTAAEAKPLDARTGPDLIYASNVSATADGLLAGALKRCPETVRGTAETVGRALIRCYGDGDAFATEADLHALIDTLIERGELASHDDTTRRSLIDALWNPLNTGLYRQQALRWVADAADALGMTLHVHGRGWDTHPEFARFDRGPLSHDALQRSTAEAKFALHLEPYICFSHHRMLDATLAGTPVLVRDHPGNHGLQDVARFLHRHVPDADHDRDVVDAITDTPALAEAFSGLVQRQRGLTWDLAGDVTAQVRAWQRAGVLPDTTGETPGLPGLDAVTFHDAASFRTCLSQRAGDPDGTLALLTRQQGAIRDRLTFTAAFRRVVLQVRDLIADETD